MGPQGRKVGLLFSRHLVGPNSDRALAERIGRLRPPFDQGGKRHDCLSEAEGVLLIKLKVSALGKQLWRYRGKSHDLGTRPCHATPVQQATTNIE